ncbi:NACHT domain-containing protein [Aspergillus homomorphus CBS 101889]|uniref:ARM repeat-containing protein n=1 Tax=Aspergillus homomorphus (strain CBS 101889) TaxID=1450537 RepID=A0A395I1J6_ASPHC|nr:ARM repeat-containing protein [Aspergillus homomorphus CBS 101889]RAL12424.1 ARM repeat-containing protein [Aspergillus homomorphus CBS 101889]
MAPPLHYPSRPKDVDEILSRLTNPACDKKEKAALQALVSSMIDRFRDQGRPSHYFEASRLSPATTERQYNQLTQVFAHAIVNNADKGTALDQDLLPSFVHILHSRPEGYPRHGPFAAVDGLRKRLDWADRENALTAQYILCHSLGALLDVAVDIKASEVDKESLRDPLLKQLRRLKDKDEPRLAQAAAYAFEALQGVSDNQGPWDIFWNTSGTVLALAAKTAGAVSAMNPEKLLEAGPNLMELLEWFKKIYGEGREMVEAMKNMDQVFVENIQRLPKQRIWYGVLRYTGLLIAAEGSSFDTLNHILAKVPCGDNWQFWCGLYAQLEQSYLRGDEQTKEKIISLTHTTLSLPSLRKSEAKEPHVQHWINLISETFGHGNWKKSSPKAHRSFPLCFLKKKTREPQLNKPFDPITTETTSAGLLTDAWCSCKEAQRFYADAALVGHYLQQNRLKILRLSNDILDIGNCYINLGIVEASSEPQSQEYTKCSLRERLKIEAPPQGKAIELGELFNTRELRSHKSSCDGQQGIPKRILIRGRAGIGKTTLCKKIVHDFINGKLPSWQFERVLWIPLRKLKENPSIENFLRREVWSTHAEKEHFLGVLLETIFDPADNRTLLLLDGYDEIVSEKTPSGDLVKSQQVLDLLNQPNVIITSRPHANFDSLIEAFDLELETVGFRPDQVNSYVDRVVNGNGENKQSAIEITNFINSHWLIKSLLQIPIQLDALCFAWNDRFNSNTMRTMTELYQAIEVKLWKRDMMPLTKLSENQVNNIYLRSQIEHEIPDHIDLVQKLAFSGLYNGIAEFTRDHLRELYTQLPGMAGKSDNMLNDLSFLRTSHFAENDRYRTYYFIHMTFQEFFAAHYFAHSWINDTQLYCVEMKSAELHGLNLTDFVHREKYNARYNIMWRFVAGLLSSQSQEMLVQFIQVLDSEPRDLLAAAHPGIMMYCFNELSPTPPNPALQRIKRRMEDGLYDLLTARVVPDRQDALDALYLLLNDEDAKVREHSARALQSRKTLPRKVLNSLAFRMIKDEDTKVREAAFKTLVKQYVGQDQPHEQQGILDLLRRRLNDEDVEARRSSVKILGSQKTFPPSILDSLAHRMIADKDISIRSAAMEAWGIHASRSENIVDSVIPFLADGNPHIRSAAIRFIAAQPIPYHHMQYLVSKLEGGDLSEHEIVLDIFSRYSRHSKLCNGILEAWGKHASRSENIVGSVISFLDDGNPHIRSAAIRFIASQPISDHYIQYLVLKLKGGDLSQQRIVLDIFSRYSRHSKLCNEILEELVAFCGHADEQNATGALGILRRYRNLSEDILESLIPLLQRSVEIESSIWEVFASQSTFPECATKPCTAMLSGSDDHSLVSFVSCAWKSDCVLPDDILELVSLHLPDSDVGVTYGVAILLRQHRRLTPKILEILISFLRSPLKDVVSSAESALRKHAEFFDMLPDVDYEIWKTLFTLWFDFSLRQFWSCILLENELIITTPERSHTIELSTPLQKQTVLKAATAAQAEILGVSGRVREEDPDE